MSKDLNKLIADDKPLFKRDNIHFNLQPYDAYNKPDNYFITTRGMGKSTVMWQKVYAEMKKGLCSIIQKVRPVEVTQMWINDIAGELNKFRKPSEYCTTMRAKGSSLKDGCLDIDIQDPLWNNGEQCRLCRVICISIDVRRFKSLVLANAGSIFNDEFLPDIRHGEKWLSGYTWRSNTLWTTFGRFAYETRGVVEKRYWFGNPYSRYIQPIFEQYNVDTLELQPGKLIVGDQYLIALPTPCAELQELLKKENPTLLNEINQEWYQFMNGQFTADNAYDLQKVQPKNFKLHWVFRVCNTLIGVFRDSSATPDEEFWEDTYKHYYWCCCLPRDYKTNQHDVYCFDFNNFAKDSILLQSADKVKLILLKNAVAKRHVSFQDINTASIVETLYTML